MSRRSILIASGILLALALLILLTRHRSHEEEAVEENPVPVKLNEVLTNELSDTSSLYGLDRRVRDYMYRWGLHGAQLSVMRRDSLLYSKGYGFADDSLGMEPGNIMRMASVSKLLTAVGIMVLQERGLLDIHDKVFGPSGILCDSLITAAIRDSSRYYRITVEDLLRHRGGFGGSDPMFHTAGIIHEYRLTSPPDSLTLTRIVMRRRPRFLPGTSQKYSNFGYLLLSMIIEKVSGQGYEDFMRENVLEPAGCWDMHIAENFYQDKRPNEVRYYVPDDDEMVEAYNGSGEMTVKCYGGNDVRSLYGAGAWVASTAELARLVASIDGRPEVPDILSAESVAQMTEYFDESTYSLGWNDTHPEHGWTRTGTFAGTTALIKYFPDGECWIFLSNTSTWRGPGLARYTAALFDDLRRSYSSRFPAQDLFSYRNSSL